jgi:hypothetical protein
MGVIAVERKPTRIVRISNRENKVTSLLPTHSFGTLLCENVLRQSGGLEFLVAQASRLCCEQRIFPRTGETPVPLTHPINSD